MGSSGRSRWLGSPSVDFPPDSLAVNQAHWDERAPAHAASPDYAIDRFIVDPEFLSDVVRFDLPRLGDIRGLRGVHLQCHIGTDTISLARLGARDDRARLLPRRPSHQARRLAAETRRRRQVRRRPRSTAPSTCSPAGGSTSCSPASGRCAGCPTSAAGPVSSPHCFARAAGCSCARPTPCCGRWTNDRGDDLVIDYPYFEHAAPLVSDEPGTYVDTDVAFTHTAQPQLEPRPRRDRHRAARRRDDPHPARRARQRAVERAARRRCSSSTAASGASPTAQSASLTATRCKPSNPDPRETRKSASVALPRRGRRQERARRVSAGATPLEALIVTTGVQQRTAWQKRRRADRCLHRRSPWPCRSLCSMEWRSAAHFGDRSGDRRSSARQYLALTNISTSTHVCRATGRTAVR